MNLSQFLISSEVVWQLVILWLINFDSILGCLSLDYKKKEVLLFNNNNRKKLSPEHFSASVNDQFSIREKLKIINFREYLLQKYDQSLKLSQLEFLLKAFKEFTRETKRKRSRERFTKYQKPQHNVTLITIDDIKSRLVEKRHGNQLIGVQNVETRSRVISRERNRYFNQEEMFHAMRSAIAFHNYSCKLMNVTFCAEKYLRVGQYSNDLYQFIPPAIWITRCPNKCSCLQPNEDCLPTSIRTRTEYILTISVSEEKSTWPLVLYDHTGCKCIDRCRNRKCIYPFRLKVSRRGVCKCVCIPGYEKKCLKVNSGYSEFSKSDYQCLVNSTCLTPSCKAGDLSEEDLYLKRCPQVHY